LGAETSADVTSQLSLKHIFIIEVDMGKFIEPRQNKEQLLEDKRSFQEPWMPRMAK
jgi:hypothetical protein